MRIVWLVGSLCLIPGRGDCQSSDAVGAFRAYEPSGAIASVVAGTYRVDSLSVYVNVDSARFWTSDTAGSEFLGGIALVLGYRKDDAWSARHRTRFTEVNRAVTDGDTVALRDIEFVVPRARARSMKGHWLVFELAIGGLHGETEIDPLAYWYTHTARDLFDEVEVRAARRSPAPSEPLRAAPIPIAGSCDPRPAGAPRPDEAIPVTLVVDTLGRVERSSVQVLDQRHLGLEDAVASFLATCQYQPGIVDGRLVRIRATTRVRF